MKIFGHFKKNPKISFKETLFLTALVAQFVPTVLSWFLLCVEVLVKYQDFKVLPYFFGVCCHARVDLDNIGGYLI